MTIQKERNLVSESITAKETSVEQIPELLMLNLIPGENGQSSLPQRNLQIIFLEIIFFAKSRITFWSCMLDFGSIGMGKIDFSMYSYRLATFLFYE